MLTWQEKKRILDKTEKMKFEDILEDETLRLGLEELLDVESLLEKSKSPALRVTVIYITELEKFVYEYIKRLAKYADRSDSVVEKIQNGKSINSVKVGKLFAPEFKTIRRQIHRLHDTIKYAVEGDLNPLEKELKKWNNRPRNLNSNSMTYGDVAEALCYLNISKTKQSAAKLLEPQTINRIKTIKIEKEKRVLKKDFLEYISSKSRICSEIVNNLNINIKEIYEYDMKQMKLDVIDRNTTEPLDIQLARDRVKLLQKLLTPPSEE